MLQRVTWLCTTNARVQDVRSISDITPLGRIQENFAIDKRRALCKKHQNQVQQLSYCSQWPRGATAVLELVAGPTGTTARTYESQDALC